MARQLIQTAYCLSILTFISRMEKEKGLGSVPYFHAIIDFHFVEHHSSCFCRCLFLPNSFESLHSIFSCSSITSRKHGSQYATELPAFQPLDSLTFHHSRRQNKGYRSIPGTVNKYILHSKARGARLFFFTRLFSQFSVLGMATT